MAEARALAACLALAALPVATLARAQDAHELPPEEAKPTKPAGLLVPVSLVGGLRAGYSHNFGKNSPPDSTNANDANNGVDLALELGSTIFDHIYGGFIVGGTFYISPTSTSASVASLLIGTEFGYLTNANGFGGFFGLGAAYRAIFVSNAVGQANKYDGPNVLATVALHFKVGDSVRILPRVDFSLGPSSSVVAAIMTVGFSIWLTQPIWPPKHHAR